MEIEIFDPASVTEKTNEWTAKPESETETGKRARLLEGARRQAKDLATPFEWTDADEQPESDAEALDD